MKRNVIRIWSFLVVIIMIMNIGHPIISYAITEGTPEKYNGFIFEKNNGEIIITGYEGTESNITVPSEYEENTITKVYISNNSLIESIDLPNGIIDINFQGCSALKEIVIPESVIEISNNAFKNCSRLEKVKLPDGLKAIGEYAFEECSFHLENIEIPDTVKKIGKGAFKQCHSLKNVKLPKNITEISEECFENCLHLPKITIPENVTKIGRYAFSACGDLQNVELHENLELIDSYAFSQCTSLKSILMPKTLEKIERDNFNWVLFPEEGMVLETIYGYENTYAEKFAKEKSVKFIALDGIWTSKEIPENQYILAISGENGEKLYDKISATINEIDYEVEDGILSFEKTLFETNEEISIKITVKNKTFDLKHIIQPTGIGFLRVPISKFDLVSVYVNGYDTLTATKLLNIAAVDKVTFELTTSNETDEVYYQILQKGRVIGEAGGISKTSIQISSDLLEKGEKIYARVCNENGEVLSKSRLNLSLVKIYLLGDENEVTIGQDVEIKLPDGMGPLAGAEFKIPLGKDTKLPIKVEASTEKFKLGITTENIEFDGEDYEKSVKAILNDKDELTTKKGCDVKFTIYKEMTFDKGMFKEDKSYGALSIKFKDSVTYNTFVWAIPVTFKLSATLGGNVEIGVEYNFEEDKVEQYGEAEIKGDLGLRAGLDFKAISGGLYGKIGTKLKLDIMPEFSFNKFELSGEAGVYAEFFGAEATIPILDPKTKLVMDDEFNWSIEDASLTKVVSLYDINSYNKSARNYSFVSLAWNQEQGILSNQKNLLADDIYTYTNQDIISNGTDTIMLFIDNDVLRDKYNFKTLKYSIYDKETKTWGTTKQLDNNETQDNNFIAYTDGTNIYVIYTEEKIKLTENNKIEDYIKNQDISVAKWNSESKTFDKITALTNNETYDMLPQINIIDDIPTAVWVNNTSNSAFGTTNDNTILYSRFENEVWSEPKKLISGQNAITEIEVGKIENESCIVTIIDGDNDLLTENDRNLKVIDFNGNEKIISTSSNFNIDIIKYNDTNTLTWYNNGNINLLQDINGETSTLFTENIENLTANNIIIKKQDNLVIVYSTETEQGQGIYQIIQNQNGEFGNPICILETENSITCYDAIFENGELLVCYTETQVNTENDEIQKTSNLYSYYSNDKYDIAISNVEYDETTFAPDDETTISVYIKNNAEIKTSKLNIKIIDTENNEIYNQTFDKEILSGKTEKLDLENVLITKCNTYTIIVNEVEQTESYLEDNQITIDIEHSDLNVSADQIVTNEGNYALVRIANEGKFDAKNVVLNVQNGEKIVDTVEIGNIEAYSTKVVWVYLKDRYFEEGRTEGIITFEAITDTEELYVSNNQFVLSALDYSDHLLGDVNNDGKLNIKDWNMVYNHINETSELTDEEFERGDVNEDGKVNIKDWNRMYDHITEVKPLW